MKRYLYLREDVILETAEASREPGAELLVVLDEDRLYALPEEAVFIGTAPPCQLVSKRRNSLRFSARTANSVCARVCFIETADAFRREACGFNAEISYTSGRVCSVFGETALCFRGRR